VGVPGWLIKIVVILRSSTWALPQCVVTNLIVRWAISKCPSSRRIRSFATDP